MSNCLRTVPLQPSELLCLLKNDLVFAIRINYGRSLAHCVRSNYVRWMHSSFGKAIFNIVLVERSAKNHICFSATMFHFNSNSIVLEDNGVLFHLPRKISNILLFDLYLHVAEQPAEWKKKKTFCKFLLHERMTHHLSFAASFASKNFHPPFASNLYRCLTSLCICTPFIASRAFHATRTALELVRSKQEFVRHEHWAKSYKLLLISLPVADDTCEFSEPFSNFTFKWLAIRCLHQPDLSKLICSFLLNAWWQP